MSVDRRSTAVTQLSLCYVTIVSKWKIVIRHCHAVMMALLTCFYNDIIITYHFCCTTHLSVGLSRDLRSFVIRFDFESYVRLEIRFVLRVRFEIFESSALSIVIRKETIGGG